MGNRILVPIHFVFISILIAAQVLLVHNSAFAAVNTRLVFVSNQHNVPSLGKGTLVLDMEAISDAGIVEIDTFRNAFQLGGAFLAQNSVVTFSDEYFGFEFGSPAHVYLANYSYDETAGVVAVNCSFWEIIPLNTPKTIGTTYQRIVRVIVEYDLGSVTGSISWLPGFKVANQVGADITGLQEPIPPELTDIALPVELTAFTAIAAENRVVLTWTTQSEINNQGFEVYRSVRQDGEYALIASYQNNESLQGAGNSNTPREYTYQDFTITAGETYWYQIADVDYQGIRTFHGPVSVEFPELIPEEYVLHPNYPNPFNPETNIRFEVPPNPANNKVTLMIYNNLGVEVRTLINGIAEPGTHTIKWDGRNNHGELSPSGVYFLRLQAGNFNQTRKMLLVQ